MQTMSVRAAIIGLILVLASALVATTQAGRSATAIRLLSGTTPQSARNVDCAWEYLTPRSSTWYRLAARRAGPLHVQLVSYPEILAEMMFEMYRVNGDQAGDDRIILDSLGRGYPADTRIAQVWEGSAEPQAAYLVNVINHSALAVGYGLCSSD
jgi:hypothetical protein